MKILNLANYKIQAYFVALLFLLISGNSCNDDSSAERSYTDIFDIQKLDSNNVRITRYYLDSTIQRVQDFYDADTVYIENGQYKSYYKSGQLQDSGVFVYGKLNDVRVGYYEDGRLRSVETYFKRGIRNNSKFKENGQLDYYQAFDYFNQFCFSVHSDSSGKLVQEGELIYSGVSPDTLPLNKETIIELLVGNPPVCDVSVDIQQWNLKTNTLISTSTMAPDKYNRVKFTAEPDPHSDTYILAAVSEACSSENIHFNDTVAYFIKPNGITTSLGFKSNPVEQFWPPKDLIKR